MLTHVVKNKYVLIEIVYGKIKLKSVSHKETEILFYYSLQYLYLYLYLNMSLFSIESPKSFSIGEKYEKNSNVLYFDSAFWLGLFLKSQVKDEKMASRCHHSNSIKCCKTVNHFKHSYWHLLNGFQSVPCKAFSSSLVPESADILPSHNHIYHYFCTLFLTTALDWSSLKKIPLFFPI